MASAAAIREAFFDLHAVSEFHLKTAQCVDCLLIKPVIACESATGEEAILGRIVAFLLSAPGQVFCWSCLAFASETALADAKRIAASLASVDEFSSRHAACSVCGRWLPVIGAVGGEAFHPPLAPEPADEELASL